MDRIYGQPASGGFPNANGGGSTVSGPTANGGSRGYGYGHHGHHGHGGHHGGYAGRHGYQTGRNQGAGQAGAVQVGALGPGGQAVKKPKRTVTDYGSTMTRYVCGRRSRLALSTCANHRMVARAGTVGEVERPSSSFLADMSMSAGRLDRPADSIPAKHVHVSVNRERHVIYVVLWTPEGRRLVTTSLAGEFTVWNGIGFNYESIGQAHSASIRAARYSNNDDWLLSGDNDGFIKYWQPNFNNIKVIQAHPEPIRGIAFAPTDSKFVTASEDSKLKIFDFANGTEEATLSGHSWELRAVDWHPSKGLIVSGSKDGKTKLWDPRSGGSCLTTLTSHNSLVGAAVFERTAGVLLATGSRDQMVRVFDLRMMRDVYVLRGNEREITSLTWHPIHPNLLSTGANDGSIRHFLLDEPNRPTTVPSSVLATYDVISPQFTASRSGVGGPTQLATGINSILNSTSNLSLNQNGSSSGRATDGKYIPSIIDQPPQTIYPAHSVAVAHEAAVWSLAWHPAGHLLVSGGQDRMTRFWTRPRPGDESYLADRYHIGQANAESHAAALARRKEVDQVGAIGGEGEPFQSGPEALPGIGFVQHPGAVDGDVDGDGRVPGLGGRGPYGHLPPPPPPGMPPGMPPPGMGMPPPGMAGPAGVPVITPEMARQLLALPAEMLEQLPPPVLAQIHALGR